MCKKSGNATNHDAELGEKDSERTLQPHVFYHIRMHEWIHACSITSYDMSLVWSVRKLHLKWVYYNYQIRLKPNLDNWCIFL